MTRLIAAMLLASLAACDTDMYGNTSACRDGDANTECPIDGSRESQAGAQPPSSDAPPDVRQLIERATAENEQCRGASGDDPETLKACNRRYEAMVELEARNWCLGGGEIAANDRWLRCSEDPDYRPGLLGSEPPFTERDIQEAAHIMTSAPK
ncbi:MAG: hypothetical protein HOP96_05855 [Sphingomonas sp.]|nr:hypothetical protein [Sphingomonas sp.]